MTGHAQVNPSVRADLGAMTRRRHGDDVVWSWSTTIDGKTVAIKVTGQALRTVAYRAAHNTSGRASQGGIVATVIRS